jgi:hypothetical protein
MQPADLIDTGYAPDLPAPMWFIQFFKVLGFSLHAVPMNLWYAGVAVAMLLCLQRDANGRRLAARLMGQMPVLVAYGVSLGIVPLLFIQVAYAKFFYPATILMAWSWFAVVWLLIPAYYGVYAYALGLRSGVMRPWRRAAGWLAAVLFVVIGLIFANAMSLMADVGRWPALFEVHNVAGAATGTALNLAAPSLWPRWLLMFGLALMTTGAWAAVDAAWLAGKESDDYRRFARDFAWKLHTAGLLWFAAAGSWYVFGTWSEAARAKMLAGPLVFHTALTALSPGLPWLLLWQLRRRGTDVGRGLAALAGLAQFGVLGINAVSRQMVQNIDLRPYFDLIPRGTTVQWSPLLGFLAMFVLALGVVGWMLVQVLKAPAEAAALADAPGGNGGAR